MMTEILTLALDFLLTGVFAFEARLEAGFFVLFLAFLLGESEKLSSSCSYTKG
jgi:hypothetical protein